MLRTLSLAIPHRYYYRCRLSRNVAYEELINPLKPNAVAASGAIHLYKVLSITSTQMPSNKDRLYVALYVRGGAPSMLGKKEDMYQWAFIVGPKNELEGKMGIRYHIKERPKMEGGIGWFYQERECPLIPTSMLLVRIMIGKIVDGSRLADILRQTPIKQDQGEWSSLTWMKEALERIKGDDGALGKSVIEWETVRHEVMAYCQRKIDQHRFDGQGNFDKTKIPTYDLIAQREIIA